jgi:hypothetical protein
MVTRGRRRRGACFILIHNQGDNKNKPPFLTGSKLPGHPLTCRTHAGDWVHVGLELYILTGPISSKKDRIGFERRRIVLFCFSSSPFRREVDIF